MRAIAMAILTFAAVYDNNSLLKLGLRNAAGVPGVASIFLFFATLVLAGGGW